MAPLSRGIFSGRSEHSDPQYEKDGETASIQFDSIVNAAGSKSVRRIAGELDKTGIPYAVAGDSNRPATIMQAIHEGFLAVMSMK